MLKHRYNSSPFAFYLCLGSDPGGEHPHPIMWGRYTLTGVKTPQEFKSGGIVGTPEKRGFRTVL
jgi:hypothetical protein